MPISTIINSPAALYALMTTTNTGDLSQHYTQTANIDMTTYTSQSIAGSDTLTPYDFTGIYDGQGYTITIGDVIDYTGLFDSIAPKDGVPLSGIVKNVNVIYQNAISVTLDTSISNNTWGGLVGSMVVSSISNCSVTVNNDITVISPYSAPVGLLCGFMGQNSSITTSRLSINGTITFIGSANTSMGLLCGECTDSDITNCSVTSSSSAFNISLTADFNSSIGLICGYCAADFLSVPIKRTSLVNNTVDLYNNGSITIGTVNPLNQVYNATICGTVYGDTTPDSTYQTIVQNCLIHLHYQTLLGAFHDLFGLTTGQPSVTLLNCQLLFDTTTDNTSRIINVTPTPPPGVAVIYINNDSGSYTLPSGNYYTPFSYIALLFGSTSIVLETQGSTDGIFINGVFYPTGSTYSSTNNGFSHTISVKGVGSMYFRLISVPISQSTVNSNAECICQINSCSTNPQTGITADSRITNIVQDKTIRINVDRQIATNSVIYPKFRSYSDYIKYIQAGLK